MVVGSQHGFMPQASFLEKQKVNFSFSTLWKNIGIGVLFFSGNHANIAVDKIGRQKGGIVKAAIHTLRDGLITHRIRNDQAESSCYSFFCPTAGQLDQGISVGYQTNHTPSIQIIHNDSKPSVPRF